LRDWREKKRERDRDREGKREKEREIKAWVLQSVLSDAAALNETQVESHAFTFSAIVLIQKITFQTEYQSVFVMFKYVGYRLTSRQVLTHACL
jgi:hypothetical protein